MTGTEWTIKATAQEPLDRIYLHLCSGDVLEIRDVKEVVMTDTHLIVTRTNDETIVIDRGDIYYSCSLPGAAPPAY